MFALEVLCSSSSSVAGSRLVSPRCFFIYDKAAGALLGVFMIDAVYSFNDICYWSISSVVFYPAPISLSADDIVSRHSQFKQLQPAVEVSAKVKDLGDDIRLSHYFSGYTSERWLLWPLLPGHLSKIRGGVPCLIQTPFSWSSKLGIHPEACEFTSFQSNQSI